MILSHMRYNSPVDSSTEQGDRGMEGRQREAGGGCLSVTSLSGKKKKAKTRGFFFAVANSFQSVKRAFLSAQRTHFDAPTADRQHICPNLLAFKLIFGL